MTGRAAIALAVAACGSPVASGASDLATLGALGLRAMDPAILETTTKFLSSNELTGRGPGTEGGMRAEQHVADQLARIGLQPAGDHGTFFQEVPLRQARLIEAESSLVFHAGGTDIGLAHGRDAMLWPEPRDANVALERRVVFAGYGIARPDLGYDDLAGVDVKDAIVVIFGGAPRTLGGRALSSTVHAVLADTDPRSVVLKARGARAVIVVRDPVHAQVVSFEKFTQIAPRVSMAWLEGGVPASLPLLPTVSISEAAFERVLAATPGSPHAHALWAELDRGAPSHIEIAATATLRIRSELHDLVARNVLARLSGGDLANETIVYSAHVDHLGIGEPVDGDPIYHGAIDDAVGVAGIIEIARGFAALPVRPRRSILFLGATGEEYGLLGSDYFVHHTPLQDLVADINIDALTPNWEPFDIIPLGIEHSTLERNTRAAARASGFVISPDPQPEEEFFIRSDQYSFVQAGVPSVFPVVGYRDAHGEPATNRAIGDAWASQHYHRPSDIWRPEYRAVWAIKEARVDFLIGLSVATETERPRWNEGDVFAPPRRSP